MPEQDKSVREQYLEQVVESASQEKLLMLLVDGAANFIRRAIIAFEKDRFEEVNNNLIKAQNIYLELVITLDLDAGEFAESLGQVYQYLYNLLIEANMEKNLDKMQTGLRLAEQIRDLWKETIEKVSAAGKEDDLEKPAPVTIDPKKVPRTGVYEPVAGAQIREAEVQSDDVPPSLNITG
jgi:flagellar protein FliS